MRPNSKPINVRRARLAAAITAGAALVAFAGAGGAAWAAGSSGTDVYVSGAGQDSAGGTWGFDNTGSPVYTFGAPAADGTPSLLMQTPASADGIRVLDTLPQPVVGADAVDTLLDGASFTYEGSPVNFQLSVDYLPTDAADYGVDGSTAACAPAGYDFPGTSTPACWTVLKYQPIASSGSARTVAINGTAGDSATSTDGWLSTKRVGQYAGTGPLIGETLSSYLGAMSSVEVTQVGVSLGSGAAGESANVLGMSFGGADYHFGPAPTSTPTATPTSTPTQSATPTSTPTATPTAVPAPAPNVDALEQVLANAGVDVAADTAAFQAPAGVSLDDVNASAPFSGSLPWHAADTRVEVFAYSTPIDLGSAPVVDGRIVLTDLDLSALGAGAHHLVFVGATTGALQAIAFTVGDPTAVTALATTGTDIPTPLLLGALGAVLAGAAILIWRRTSPRHS